MCRHDLRRLPLDQIRKMQSFIQYRRIGRDAKAQILLKPRQFPATYDVYSYSSLPAPGQSSNQCSFNLSTGYEPGNLSRKPSCCLRRCTNHSPSTHINRSQSDGYAGWYQSFSGWLEVAGPIAANQMLGVSASLSFYPNTNLFPLSDVSIYIYTLFLLF